jgi:hypothetical protein
MRRPVGTAASSAYRPFETCRLTVRMSANWGKTGSERRPAEATRLTDAVEKVFLCHRAQILRAVSAPIRKLFGGIRCQATNSPVTSVVELKAHRMTIGACFVFRREISRSLFWDFFDSIDPHQTLDTYLASETK